MLVALDSDFSRLFNREFTPTGKIPNPRRQIPGKSQKMKNARWSGPRADLSLAFLAFCVLKFLWDLFFGAWDLPIEACASIGPSRFVDLNVTTENEQTHRRDRSGEGKYQPHHLRTAFALRGTERRQNPSTRADQKFTNQKRNVGKCAVRSFLTRWRDRRGVFVNARRIERFADGKDREIERGHNVIGMNR